LALEVLARCDDRLRDLAARVEALDVASADGLFGDLLVRAELEAAIGRSEASGPDGASSEPLRWLLGEALASIARRGGQAEEARGAEQQG
jgi:hypothetical protein